MKIFEAVVDQPHCFCPLVGVVVAFYQVLFELVEKDEKYVAENLMAEEHELRMELDLRMEHELMVLRLELEQLMEQEQELVQLVLVDELEGDAQVAGPWAFSSCSSSCSFFLLCWKNLSVQNQLQALLKVVQLPFCAMKNDSNTQIIVAKLTLMVSDALSQFGQPAANKNNKTLEELCKVQVKCTKYIHSYNS